MDNSDVATDFKLKKFLADVETYFERSKLQNEDSASKQQMEGKSRVEKEKISLLEKDPLSKPSVKGILGLKNKARKVGNLENLLKDNTSKEEYSPSAQSTTDSLFGSEQKGRTADKKTNDKGLSDWWRNYTKKATKEQDNVIKLKKEKKTFSKNLEKNELIDGFVSFSNKKADECIYGMSNPLVREENTDNILAQLNTIHKRIFDKVERRLMEKISKNDPSFISEFKSVFDEFVKEQKPRMVDECEQTEDRFFEIEADEIETNIFPQGNMLTPKRQEVVQFDLPVPATGKPQAFSHCYSKSSPSKFNNFFETVCESSKKEAETFGFVSKKTSKPHFLSPQMPLSVVVTPDLPPPGDGGMCWLPVTQKTEKSYFPPILSPPSPGRKYLKYPVFLEDSQCSHTQNSYIPSKENDLKLNSPDPSTAQLFTNPSTSSSIPFPKRPKVTFSPHRL